MISIAKQKKLLFIPFINIAILFIMVFVNSRYMKEKWQFCEMKYMIYGTICFIPIFLLNDLLSSYGYGMIIDLLAFYIFIVIHSCFSLLCQKKFGIKLK